MGRKSWRHLSAACAAVALAIAGAPAAATEVPPPQIPSAYPFEDHYVEVLGARMHYVDEGEGPVILMLHGNPTWSYIWRNVIPYLTPQARVIAVDNIGFGRSDKPDIDYTFADQSRYIDGFIEAMGLTDITLVVHDWGSALGLHYAARHEDNVRGVAFMEAIVAPAMPTSYATLPPQWADFFRAMRDPASGHEFVVVQNGFVNQVIPGNVVRELTDAEMDFYREPFPTEDTRVPALVWPNQIPIDGEPADVVAVVEAYNAWLAQTDVPKLHLYASPGALNPPMVAEWLAANVPNIETAFIGQGLHYVQEDQPEAIGRAIADWFRRLPD
ncbi:MAG: haloalkane dehalogenase [Rhodospirillaceae bacterium]|nr:haloalkane dehalogenase [Rhodospirillaceae bacterium]